MAVGTPYRRFERRHESPEPGNLTNRDRRPLVDREVRQPDRPDFEPPSLDSRIDEVAGPAHRHPRRVSVSPPTRL